MNQLYAPAPGEHVHAVPHPQPQPPAQPGGPQIPAPGPTSAPQQSAAIPGTPMRMQDGGFHVIGTPMAHPIQMAMGTPLRAGWSTPMHGHQHSQQGNQQLPPRGYNPSPFPQHVHHHLMSTPQQRISVPAPQHGMQGAQVQIHPHPQLHVQSHVQAQVQALAAANPVVADDTIVDPVDRFFDVLERAGKASRAAPNSLSRRLLVIVCTDVEHGCGASKALLDSGVLNSPELLAFSDMLSVPRNPKIEAFLTFALAGRRQALCGGWLVERYSDPILWQRPHFPQILAVDPHKVDVSAVAQLRTLHREGRVFFEDGSVSEDDLDTAKAIFAVFGKGSTLLQLLHANLFTAPSGGSLVTGDLMGSLKFCGEFVQRRNNGSKCPIFARESTTYPDSDKPWF